jgi:hypothetical protein
MKGILTLVVCSILVACNTEKIPQFPQISTHYVVDIPGKVLPKLLVEAIVNPSDLPEVKEVSCLAFDIVSKHPYQLKFNHIAGLQECNGVGGYKPDDMVLFLNWVDDVSDIAQKNRHCFK